MKFDEIIKEDYINKHDKILQSIFNILNREYKYDDIKLDTYLLFSFNEEQMMPRNKKLL